MNFVWFSRLRIRSDFFCSSSGICCSSVGGRKRSIFSWARWTIGPHVKRKNCEPLKLVAAVTVRPKESKTSREPYLPPTRQFGPTFPSPGAPRSQNPCERLRYRRIGALSPTPPCSAAHDLLFRRASAPTLLGVFFSLLGPKCFSLPSFVTFVKWERGNLFRWNLVPSLQAHTSPKMHQRKNRRCRLLLSNRPMQPGSRSMRGGKAPKMRSFSFTSTTISFFFSSPLVSWPFSLVYVCMSVSCNSCLTGGRENLSLSLSL